MSMFIEVDSVQPKSCKLIINLDYVLEIAPLISGGCVLTIGAAEAGTSRTLTVSNDYTDFNQFVLQRVSASDIQKRFPKVKKNEENIKPQDENSTGVEFK